MEMGLRESRGRGAVEIFDQPVSEILALRKEVAALRREVETLRQTVRALADDGR